MENSAADDGQAQRQKRRRSHKKSDKAIYERNRRLKSAGLWLLTCIIGGLVVAAIAIFAGRAAG